MNILGEGSFGRVVHVRHELSNKEFAVKTLSKSKIHKLKMEKQVENEILIHMSLKHPCIVNLETFF